MWISLDDDGHSDGDGDGVGGEGVNRTLIVVISTLFLFKTH